MIREAIVMATWKSIRCFPHRWLATFHWFRSGWTREAVSESLLACAIRLLRRHTELCIKIPLNHAEKNKHYYISFSFMQGGAPAVHDALGGMRNRIQDIALFMHEAALP